MFKVGDKWITEKDIRRIKENKDNYDLFEGEHWEVFKYDTIARLKLGFQVTDDGFFTNMINGEMVSTGVNAESFFISENILGECTGTYTTLMLSETPELTSETNQAFIYEMSYDVGFHDMLLESANRQSAIGWAAVKTRLVDDEIEIELLDNEHIFIIPQSDNRNKIDYILYAYKIEEETSNKKTVTLVNEEHYADKIIYVNYLIENDTIKAILPQIADGTHPERHYEDSYSWEENTTGYRLIQILNNTKSDGILADTDYTDTAVSSQREYAVRSTQTAISMDKTLNPTLQAPEGLFTKNPRTGKMEANIVGKAIPTAEGDKEVKYVEYNGNYDIIKEIQCFHHERSC